MIFIFDLFEYIIYLHKENSWNNYWFVLRILSLEDHKRSNNYKFLIPLYYLIYNDLQRIYSNIK